MIVSIIVAVAENYVIGNNNKLIWHLPKDMLFFKQKTINHHIITGRKNYFSIPEKFRPLQDRTNIILTHQTGLKEPTCIIEHSLDNAINYAKEHNETEVFIIGGGQIYKEALAKNCVDKMYITHIHQSFEGDTYFPMFDKKNWKISKEEKHLADEKHNYAFTFTEYIKVSS